ncbi:MAG: hypothetical protein NMNS01_20000 [Nitrosomonas sp.]|nr:MAG: hypothetical protein NMNS01_20000 [Nitrosomonas sp.]
MRFIHNNLGHRKRDEIIEVTLSSGANVRLMNGANFSNYKNGRRYQYIGGLAKCSPLRLRIPDPGHWHIAIDTQGLKGYPTASVRVLPGAPHEAQEESLFSVSNLTRGDSPSAMAGTEKGHDVYICHVSEDKDDVVRPLYDALTREGLAVLYDEFALRMGDCLRQKIDKGLAISRAGLVVLSPYFIGKRWANYELDGVVTRIVSGEKILLPIWHNITKQQILDYSPSLAKKVARSTATHTMGEIAKEIAELLGRR